jgi:hypothetical protein
LATSEPHDEDEEVLPVESAEPVKGSEPQEEGGAQLRKGPRRRGRRGGRRGRGGQRQLRPGEEAYDQVSAAADALPQNGGTSAPHAHEAPATDEPEPKPREAERVFETVAASTEQPAKSGEAQTEPETPRRRGWWQR